MKTFYMFLCKIIHQSWRVIILYTATENFIFFFRVIAIITIIELPLQLSYYMSYRKCQLTCAENLHNVMFKQFNKKRTMLGIIFCHEKKIRF